MQYRPSPDLWAPCCLNLVVQVKLLKCLVDNIVVDVSYNQIGGLCTLNFLEEVNRRINDAKSETCGPSNHLFKKSIILVSLAQCGGVQWWRHALPGMAACCGVALAGSA